MSAVSCIFSHVLLGPSSKFVFSVLDVLIPPCAVAQQFFQKSILQIKNFTLAPSFQVAELRHFFQIKTFIILTVLRQSL